MHSETTTSSTVPQVDIHNSPCSTIASNVSHTGQRIVDVQSPQSYQPNGHLSGPTPQGTVHLPSIGGLLQWSNQDPHYPQGAHVTDGLATSCRQSPPMSGVPTAWGMTANLDPVASTVAGDSDRYLDTPLYGGPACLESTPAVTLPPIQRPSSDLGGPAASTYSCGEKQDGHYDSRSAPMASMQPAEKRKLGQETLDGKPSRARLSRPCTLTQGPQGYFMIRMGRLLLSNPNACRESLRTPTVHVLRTTPTSHISCSALSLGAYLSKDFSHTCPKLPWLIWSLCRRGESAP